MRAAAAATGEREALVPQVAVRLWSGSADPHGVGSEDRAPKPRPPTVNMAWHVRAAREELLRRPLPEANTPPATVALAPPEQQAAAPVVTAVEQVVRPQFLRLYRGWVRQLRRCLRAAARGDASLARRLRPEDKWIDHQEATWPEMAAWDWDFRPLAEGLPAIPIVVSDGDSPPATSLRLHEVEVAAAGFADAGIISEMLHGVSDDSRCRRGTLLCAPHAGALAKWEVAVAKLGANAVNGWATGGWGLPCWPLRTCPYSVVDESARAGKPKFRLTTDLSWPHPGTMWADGAAVDSVNDGMDRSDWPANPLVRVRDFAEAAAVMGGGVGDDAVRSVKLWGLDCEAFYRAVGRQRREIWRNGVFLPDGVMLDERCCFGDASAATKCARISNFLVFHIRRALDAVDEMYPMAEGEWLQWQQLRSEAGLADVHSRPHWAAMYIDDVMGVSADDLLVDREGRPALDGAGIQRRRAQAHFEAARGVLERFGWSSAESKEAPPSDRVEALGVLLDVREGRMWLGELKRERYAAQAKLVAAMRTCERETYDQLLGRLQFACQCYPVGRQYMHALWRLSRAAFRLRGGAVRVTRSAVVELRWWAAQLEDAEHEGLPLAAHAMGGVEGQVGVVYADASEGGFSAWALCDDGVVRGVADVWAAAESATMIIAELELLASTLGLVALAPWLPLDVVSFTDNTVAEAAMRRLSTRTPIMQAVARRRTCWMQAEGRVEVARRITSKANLWADIGSRPELGGWREVARQAAALGYPAELIAVPQGWRDIEGLLQEGEPAWI